MLDRNSHESQRLLLTLEMIDAGLQMKRQTLKRRHAELNDEEITQMLRAWLMERPGAEDGDAEGRRSDRFVE